MRIIRLLLALLIMAIPAASFAQIGVSIAIGPPEMPVYEQPLCPGDGYLWTPGYWAYNEEVSDYYWVAGDWIMAPEVGFLWTPGYWGWGGGGFLFNAGYWGPTVGFYGGINYGFGYFGEGYGGGRWDNGHFFYNRSVNHVDITNIHNVYNTTIVHTTIENRVSYNGGKGGIEARPTPEQESAAKERHIPAVAAQTEHAQTARANPELRASVNHGKPPAVGASKPADSNERGAAAPKEASEPAKSEAVGKATEPAKSEPVEKAAEPHPAVHPKDLPPIAHPAPSNSGNAKADKKYDQQQDKLIARQGQERDKLQQKQESEHQQKASDSQNQKLEQKHQEQTEKQTQKHTAEQQTLQTRQPQPKPRK